MSSPIPAPVSMRAGSAAAVAGLAGFACMGIELTAVRLLAPHFGDSAYVWTNVIGVILLALALGAWLGGRLAERAAGSPLAPLLLGAALCAALAPLLARPLGGWLLPQELPLDAAMPALVWGSLIATALLFAPAVFLLGALAPGLVVAAARAGTPLGRAAGAVSAAGTLGSLVGTFAATHWLVPWRGCRETIWLCALVLALSACLVRRSRVAAAGLLLVAASVLAQRGPLRAPLPGTELLAERETRYQYLQVVRQPDGPARIELKINEGLDSFHSVAVEGSVFTAGGYYDYHAVAPLLAGDGRRPADLRALSLGDAAGTFRRIYAGVYPGAAVDAVEIDAGAVELGDRFFDGRRATGRMVTDLDGRVFVDHAAAQWHVIHVDAYSHQVYIPAHLASREFFAAVRARLLPGGVVACNVGGITPEDPVLTAIARTMAAEFGGAAALHVPRSRNFLLVARRDRPVDPAALRAFTAGGERLAAADQQRWEGVVATAREADQWVRFPPPGAGEHVLADDRPELDELLGRSYFVQRDPPGPTAFAGHDRPEAAEAAAAARLAARDPRGVLLAAATSSGATALLHWLCGSARWELRQLHGAQADYEAGLRLDAAPDLLARLRADLDGLRADLRPHEAAEAVAARDRWLALGALLLLCLLAGGIARSGCASRFSRRRA